MVVVYLIVHILLWTSALTLCGCIYTSDPALLVKFLLMLLTWALLNAGAVARDRARREVMG